MARWLIGYSRCPHTVAALEAQGHTVYTCDLLPSDHPRHLQCDVWDVLGANWDAAILHPMCTYLTTSAAWAFKDPDHTRYPETAGYHQRVKAGTLTGAARREARDEALENFQRLLDLPFPVAIENPARSFVAKAIRSPDQIIQPYEYGDNASKATGLWFNSAALPYLVPDPAMRVPGRVVRRPDGRTVERWGNQTDSGQNKLGPDEGRWLARSATYKGIAEAMGTQWGRVDLNGQRFAA